MTVRRINIPVAACAVLMAATFVIMPGCVPVMPDPDGGGDGGSTLAGRDGSDGVSCWDVNGNGVGDPGEDVNADGRFDALDCQGAGGTAGSVGLNCWDTNANGFADPDEDRNGDGFVDARDCPGADGAVGLLGPAGPVGATGATGSTGSTGSTGATGAPGPEFFSVVVDDFFETEASAPDLLPILLSRTDEPALGSASSVSDVTPTIVFQAAIPKTYDPRHAVTLRLFLYRAGAFIDDCFVFTIEAFRLQDGADIEAYGPMRWVRVGGGDAPNGTSGDQDDGFVLLAVDLPLNRPGGLAYPDDLTPGDFLTFRLATSLEDGRIYYLLAAELFEADDADTALRRAAVFFSDEVSCVDCDGGLPDCNGNGVLDACDLQGGTSDDCNENGIPDECDLCRFDGGTAAIGTNPPFPFLQPGFTQELFAVAPDFLGGMAFAPDGDLLVDECPGPIDSFAGSSLRRFDAQTTIRDHESDVHPLVADLASNAGCGLTNHPDGSLYSNTGLGVTNLDADTGSELRVPLGPPGNSLGIAVNPTTGILVYVGADNGRLYFVDPVSRTSGLFSTETEGALIQGLLFDSSGAFLFCANRTTRSVTILRGDGTFVQDLPIADSGTSHEPASLALNAASDPFVLVVNLDGSMTRLNFPGQDYERLPIQTRFAAGGFRSDTSQVGLDGCLYVSQVGVRYADGTQSLNERSVVRICGGFVPAAREERIALIPQTAALSVGQQHTVFATVTRDEEVQEGVDVSFLIVSGPSANVTASSTTDAAGRASFTYVGLGGQGVDRIQASLIDGDVTFLSSIVTGTWTFAACSLDCDANDVPDECELIGRDCNGNGVLDECDGGCGE